MKSSDEMMGNSAFLERVTKMLTADSQLLGMFPDMDLNAAANAEGLATEEAVDVLLAGYAERPAMAMRDYEISVDAETGSKQRQYLPSFNTVSYGDFRSQVQSIASAWRHDPVSAVHPDEFVCIIGFTSIDYAAIDLACLYAQAVSVPLQSTTSGADFDEIFANVEPVAVAATIADLVDAAEHVAKQGGVRSLIAFDFDERDDNDQELFQQAQKILSDAGSQTQLVTLASLVQVGAGYDWQVLPAHPEGVDRMAMILHSSGSTGKPKGAMITTGALRHWWLETPDSYPTVSVMFMPLNHGMGKLALTYILRKGSLAYFTVKPDMSTLFEDIRIARPTMLYFFPRILELIYQHYKNEVASRVRSGSDEEAARRQVKEEMRFTYLGDRLLTGLVGSAPTPQVIKEFVVDCFQIPLKEGYGNTEAGSGSVTMDDIIQRPNVIDYKLIDVPELGYFTTDKPYPRGELCYKTRFGIKGYYKDPEATAALYDKDGFSLTGDIVEERDKDHVVLIDRRKDVLKLSQGEYVAVGPLGTVFESGSAVIEQVYIYGNSNRAYLLAVVVPDKTALSAALGENPAEEDVRNLIRNELQNVARDQQLKSFEVPRDFIIENEPFSVENGLLSSVRKRLRPQFKVKYGERLEEMYVLHERKQQQSLEALKQSDSTLSVFDKLTKLAAIELGLEQVDGSKPYTFAELGGDSLGAVAFSVAIEDVFGVNIPGDSILSPTGNLRKWADEIEDQLNDSSEKPDFNRVHGRGVTEVRASDLSLDKFLDEKTLREAPEGEPSGEQTSVVLLTGANGFLGREVCIQWMQKLAAVDGKLICIIRAEDDARARQRLDLVFESADPELKQLYHHLADSHLEVLAGDAAEKYLGLGEQRFTQLADQVTRICHVAALVNHRLPYQHLFGPNVVGTAEIIRLAATSKIKTIDFVSTEAAIPLLDATAGGNEDAEPLQAVILADSYAGGYATSKWASEVLLRNANQHLGVPVNILRGNMMLAHQHYPGQINTADMFTRLLYSVVVTGLAPYSFYPLAEDGSKQSQHYDGLPVDVVAGSVIAVAKTYHTGCHAFNICNYHHTDNCSLDTFVDWIESYGYKIVRIDDYQLWFDRFKDKLNTLPEEQKQYSALEVLGAYQQPNQLDSHIEVDCKNFRGLVSGLYGESGLPHIDERFIHKCLSDMKILGLISDQ